MIAVGYNDLWQWNTTANMWTWLTGGPSLNQIGSYGVAGSFSQSNTPPSQERHSMTVNPLTGTLLVYGGYSTQSVYLGDVWVWDPKTNFWAWISGGKGANTYATYGTMNVESLFADPGSRMGHSADINVNTGELFVFGGLYSKFSL